MLLLCQIVIAPIQLSKYHAISGLTMVEVLLTISLMVLLSTALAILKHPLLPDSVNSRLVLVHLMTTLIVTLLLACPLAIWSEYLVRSEINIYMREADPTNYEEVSIQKILVAPILTTLISVVFCSWWRFSAVKYVNQLRERLKVKNSLGVNQGF